ncbi:MAG TPA: BTAD domain-containing putative transcriptional regulator [Gemmatimonadaceae bacterium]
MSGHTLELRILGPTELRGSEAGLNNGNLPPPKRLALLAWLALETTDGFRRRDQIVGMLWPDLPQDGARAQLRKALHELRERLGPDAIVSRGETEVRLDDSQIWCDAVALIDHVRRGEWTQALGLFRGELLEGLFVEGVAQEWEEWLSDKRRALREHAARAAWECSRIEEEGGDRKAAAAMARRALDLTPDDEDGVRRLMSLLDQSGDRAGALRVYGDWRSRLESEYGVEPAPETRKLARRVQAARKGESHETPPLGAPPLEAATVAVVVPASPQSAVSPAVAPPPSLAPKRRPRTALLYGSVLVLVLMVSGAVLLGNPLSRTSAPPRSLAIFPVQAIGVGLEGPALGIAEELTTAMVLVPGLTVYPAARTTDVGECNGDVICVGHRLRVAHVLDGALQKSDTQLRITLRLIRTNDGAALWAGSYDVDVADGAAALTRVAAVVAKALRPIILGPDF